MILNSNKFSNRDYTSALFASLSFHPNLKIVKNGKILRIIYQNHNILAARGILNILPRAAFYSNYD